MNAIGDPNFQLMVDFYHLASEKEDPAIIVRAGDTSGICTWPILTDACFRARRDEYDYAPFFAALRTIGYDKRISVEASTRGSSADAPLAIALVRRAFRGNTRGLGASL